MTRADVARAAGVSPALVSYVLNDGPRPVSADARARVLGAIDELGYRPNRIARALSQSRTNSIAMLMPDHENPHFAELAQAVEDEAFAADQVLMIGTTDNDPERERSYLRSFLDRQVDGLLLISAGGRPDLELITRARIPVVLLDRAPAGTDAFSTVVIDNAAAAELAVNHLLGHGRQHLVCLSGPPHIEAVKQREEGWRRALTAAGRPVPEPRSGTFSREGGYRAMLALLAEGVEVDGIFTTSDAQGIGALRALTELGRRVPEDISVVSFDGTTAGRFTQPALTSVAQDVVTLARTALQTLRAQLEDGPREPVHRVLHPTLRLGGSCGCEPASGFGG
ncbi:LacI family DNA-binding transcriptional regulator [Auraticoccus monumenti]|uniref:Transcriptional regulator, LacI family n=1 Tax=Auraticoccus monumenti TaxID=675864 RepID=A0A1G6T568_9ACTN|nr:LacI family DNA-binding transcriptional regulator [Auraticoccus monumenti]SDD24292.1 transcriptional regulator, LacI family [Auraticoccus monumenti]